MRGRRKYTKGTLRTAQVQTYIERCAAAGMSSVTIREIMQAVGISSTSVARYHINILVKQGKFQRDRNGRLILQRPCLARYNAHVIWRRGNVVTLALYGGDEEKIHEDKFYHIEVYEDDSLSENRHSTGTCGSTRD